MRYRRSLIVLLMFIMIISTAMFIKSKSRVTYAAYCQGKTENILNTVEVNNVFMWGLDYNTTVNNIVSKMSSTDYTYPLTVNDLKDLNMPYLYCRGHNTYLRGTGTNTITRSGDLGSYTITTITGKSNDIGSYEHEEVDTYTEASKELTFNEWGMFERKVDTAANIYKDLKIFHVPGINGDAEENDDHYCEEDQFTNEYTYGKTYDTVTMSRYKIAEEETLYTDETTPGYMAYDAAKSYILTVVKGGHHGPGQLAFWKLKDQIGLTGWEGKKEVHTVSEETVIKELALDSDSLYDTKIITEEVKEEEETPDNNETVETPAEDTYQEEDINYDDDIDGPAGVLYQEAIQLGRHVYATEMFKKEHDNKLIADCTDYTNINVNYVKDGDYYLVGPFNVEYIRSVIQSQSSLIDTVKNSPNSIYSFGGITGVKLTYKTMKGDTKYLTLGTPAGDAVEANDGIEFVITDEEPKPRSFDTAYQFPYPGEDFYIKVPYQGENEQDAIKTLNGIEYTMDNSYANGKVYNLEGVHYDVTWNAKYEGFACEEEGALCDTHHITPSTSHCKESNTCYDCCKHSSPHGTKQKECQGYTGDDRKEGDDAGSAGYYLENSCNGHTDHSDDEDGNCTSSCDWDECSHNSKCAEEATRCNTHHYTVGTTHYRNRSYWLEPTVGTVAHDSQPLMWMAYSEVHKRTYTAKTEFEIDMTMDFGGFVWVDAYTQKGTLEDGSTYYYNDDIYDPSIQIDNNGVDALKQYVEVYLLKKVKDGKTATGTKYESDYNANIRDDNLYHATNSKGEIIKAITDKNGEYFFDEIPVLNSNYEGYVVAFVYDGQTYTAVDPLYKQIAKTQPVSEEASEEYINATFKYNKFYNSSMGSENPDERQDFNNKFEEFLGKNDIDLTAHSTVGQVYGNEYDGSTYSKNYNEIDYTSQTNSSDRVVSKLVTTAEDGMTDPFYKLESRTSEAGLVYPLEDVYNIRMGNAEVDALGSDANYNNQDADIDFKGTNVTNGGEIKFDNIETTYGTNQNSTSTPGNGKSKGYTARINLGLVTRPQADLSVTKDLYTARTIVKGQDMTYAYGEALRTEEEYSYAGLTSTNDTTTWTDTRDVQTAIGKKKIFYNLYLYESDYDYNSAVEYITQSDDIKRVRMGRYATTDGYGNATSIKDPDLLYNQGREEAQLFDTELRAYLTYKITIRNEGSVAVLAEVNELIDYHDNSLQLITKDVYAALANGEENQMFDEEGNPNKQLVATASKYYYYKAGQNEAAYVGDLVWSQHPEEKGKAIISGSEYDKKEDVNYTKLVTNKNSFVMKDESGNESEIKLAKNERIEIYVTYRIKEEARDVYIDNNGTLEKVYGVNGYEESGQLILGHKYNIAEVGNYSTYAKSTPNAIYGRVDKDSAPDNINLSDGDEIHYDDDGDAAPPINVSLLDSTVESLDVSDKMGEMRESLQKEYAASRTITGTVWEDTRTTKISDYESYVGNGILDENEARIQGITVQLVEVIETATGISKEVLLPDKKSAGDLSTTSGEVALGPVDNEGECDYRYETKTDSKGVYTFTNVPAGTYIVRFIYGKDIITTPYYKESGETGKKVIETDNYDETDTEETREDIQVSINHNDETVTYSIDEGLTQKIIMESTFEEMPSTYNGQDYKSTTYQPNVDTNINSEGYIDNEWDYIDTSNAGERVSDARDNEVRRLENIAYSRTVNNKVATELDALSTNESPSALTKYGFCIGIINGLPQIMVDTSATENGIPNNSQTQLTTVEKVGDVKSYVIKNEEALVNVPDLASVSSYTWMYADTAKINFGLENEMLSKEIMSNFIISEDYNNQYKASTGSDIDYGNVNPQEYAKDMLSIITHKERIVSPVGEPDATSKENSIRTSAYIYNVLPGQIQVSGINNFDLNREELEEKFGYGDSETDYEEKIISYPLVNRIYNVDFGIVERPKTKVELEKWISSLKLELSDGRVLFDIPFREYVDTDGVLKTEIITEECSSDVYDTSTQDGREAVLSNLQSVNNTDKVQGFIHVDMDDELLQGSVITVGYKMRVTNDSEVDTVGLLSYFDDGDTVMRIADYIKKTSIEDVPTLNLISTATTGTGKLEAYFNKIVTDINTEIIAVSNSSDKTEVEKQLEIAKLSNVKERLEKGKTKITVLGDKIERISEYKLFNPPIGEVAVASTPGGSEVVSDIPEENATTPYGLFLGTTYYTGNKATTEESKVYAVESRVEQIVDYVDTQLGLDESTIGVENSSWTKLDLAQLFGVYTQSNVLNGANPLDIGNEGTLINIFESAVINISEEVLKLVNEKLLVQDQIDFKNVDEKNMAEEYRKIYETLLTYVGVDVTIEELVNSLGDKGIAALIEIYNQINNSTDDDAKKLLQSIIAGLTITDKDGNSYITVELNDEGNELRNNVVISVNDPNINTDIGNYLIPKILGETASPEIFGTNNNDSKNTKFSADIALYAQKTVSATALNDEISNMVFNNAAEIVQISNKVGRKDKMAVAGNLLIAEGEWESTTGYDPDEGKEVTRTTIINPSASSQIFAEYDSAATARIIFTPPTGRGLSAIINNEIFQGGLIGLVVLAVGIVAIKVIFFKKKKIYK